MLLIVSARAATSPLASTVNFWRRFPSATAVTTLTIPRTWSVRLAAENAFRADFAGDARDFRGKPVELIDHGVDGVFEFENLATHVHSDFLGKIAIGHGNRHLGDVTDLAGEVGGHGVDVVGQVLP